MFRNILPFSLLLLTMLFCNSCGTVHGYVRTGLSLGNGTYFNQGRSPSASLRIFYHSPGNGIRSAYEGGVIETGNHDFLMVPEYGLSVMMVQMRSASGWTQSWDRPVMQQFPKSGVWGMKFSPQIRWNSEVLTVTVTYCDARGIPSPAVSYEYTINKPYCP